MSPFQLLKWASFKQVKLYDIPVILSPLALARRLSCNIFIISKGTFAFICCSVDQINFVLVLSNITS